MRRLCLTLSRFAITAWVGAAVLFVVTAVEEQTSPQFTSEMKSQLAVLRFPAYYAFGFALLATALVTGMVVGKQSIIGRGRRWIYRVLLVIALAVMLVDYLAIYEPLARMLAADEAARPENFQTYHEASKYANAGHVGVSLLAALLICWPGKKSG